MPCFNHARYDAENRLGGVINLSLGTSESYLYDSQNKRIFKWKNAYDYDQNASPYTVYTYGPSGRVLGAFTIQAYTTSTGASLGVSSGGNYGYFGGRLLAVQDRVGSARQGQSFYPYGETKSGGSTGDTLSFATYSRDGSTGLDYADQRFYGSQWGRFMSPDPYRASGGVGSPASWNRYSYTEGDPVNFKDPQGLYSIPSACDNGGSCLMTADTAALFSGDDYPLFGGYIGDWGTNMPVCQGGGSGFLPGGNPGSGSPGMDCFVVEPLPAPSAQTADCDIEVQHAAIGATGNFAVHSYLYVTDRQGVSVVLEGIGEPLVGGYLNPYKSATGLIIGDNPSNKPDYDAKNSSGLSMSQLCDDVDHILSAFDSFPKDEISYFLAGRSAPNSNSFVRYLLTFAADLGKVKHSRRAVGWNHRILGR